MDLGITDFDDSYPKRKPWLIIIVGLLLAGVIALVFWKRNGDDDLAKTDPEAGMQ